ncbi:MAG: phosphatidate cytidylyltransferase [Shinella sp.]|nr:phosphatidate cytidylyltransferase [Shinella sp.]
MQSELRLRILSGVVLAVVVLAATLAGGLAFRLVSAAIGLLVYYEWSTITRLPDVDFRGNAFGWLTIAVASAFVVVGDIDTALLVVVAASVAAAIYATALSKSRWLAGGMFYSGLTALSLAAIRGIDFAGLVAMLFVFAVVWATDILAYFVGRALKGPKLAPAISPGKTWSGAIGGTIAAVVAGTALYMVFFPLNGVWIPFVALLLSICSQIGDLFESFIKRLFGAKDSSRLIPGHGGVMDRVDGLVFACFAAFLLALAHAAARGNATSVGAFLLGL